METLDSLPVASSRDARHVVRRLVRPNWLSVGFGIILLVVGNTLSLLGTHLFGEIIDAVTRQPNQSSAHLFHVVDVLGAAIVVSVLIGAIGTFFGLALVNRVVERCLYGLRQLAFDSIMAAPLGLIEGVGTGDPLSRMTADVAALSDASQGALPTAVASVFTFVLAMLALVLTSPVLALAALAGFPVLWLVSHRYMKLSVDSYPAERAAASATARELYEIADGARAIRMFRARRRWQDRLRTAREREWETSWGPTQARCELYSGSNVATLFSLLAVLTVGLVSCRSGAVSLGTISAASLYVVQVYFPIGELLDTVDSLQQAMSAGSRLVGLTLIESVRSDSDVEPEDGSVELRDVHFGYNEDRTVLHGVDLVIESASGSLWWERVDQARALLPS